MAREPADLDEAVTDFVAHRGRLSGNAYRVLGASPRQVQEGWLRRQKADRAVVRGPVAFRDRCGPLAVKVARSARCATRPPPGRGGPSRSRIGRGATRAAYVLREAFGYSYAEIAGVLRFDVINVWQIVSRARRHLAAPRGSRRLLTMLVARTGDVASPEAQLTP